MGLISDSTRTKAEKCTLRTRIAFGNENEAVRFMLKETANFRLVVERATLKETSAAEAYQQSKSLLDEFENEGDDRAEDKRIAEDAIEAAKTAADSAVHEASLVRNQVYQEQKHLLAVWKKSLNNFVDREFDKLTLILYPVNVQANNTEYRDDDAEEEQDDLDSNDEQDEDDEDFNEKSSKSKGHSDDEEDDDDDDEGGPASFVLEDLNNYPKKSLVKILDDDMEPLTSVLQDNCMSSKIFKITFVLISNYQFRQFSAKQILQLPKCVSLNSFHRCNCLPVVQNLVSESCRPPLSRYVQRW